MDGIESVSQVFLEAYRTTHKEETVQEYVEKVFKYPLDQFADQIPDLPPDLEWMNTTQPLSLYSDLEGKLVILEFFTYCCINCIHVQSELKKLEEQFSVEDGLIIIGVHSAKFSNEKITANISDAVRRYNIKHPVINDKRGDMWNALSVVCWPTLFVIGPHGKPLLMIQGEGFDGLLKYFVKHALITMKTAGQLSNTSLPQLTVTESLVHYGQLLYPGKVTSIVDEYGDSLIAISDTGHNRILVVSEDGIVKTIVGGRKRGFKNGSFIDCQFNSPQGLVFKNKNILLVADTENHAIRQIDLVEQTVNTVAGNGVQGYDYVGGKLWTKQQISSPWDLCFSTDNKNILYIAMAGTHQIWALFLDEGRLWNSTRYGKGTCIAVAGSGREENRNNCYPKSASFAQPSGLSYCSNPPSLFIADSESSSIRQLHLSDGKVCAVVGGARDPKDLFHFGDADGIGFEVKLQHPLDVAWNEIDKKLYIADSYNHKIKQIYENGGYHCVTLPININLNEPGGLCMMKDNLLIADTNNHCIRKFRFDDNLISVLHVAIPKNLRSRNTTDEGDIIMNNNGGKIDISTRLSLTENAKIDVTSGNWTVDLPDNTWKILNGPDSSSKFQLNAMYSIVAPGNSYESPATQLCFMCELYLCADGVCFAENLMFVLNVRYSENASSQVVYDFNYLIKPKVK